MRLTQMHKEAFVRGVMLDVPGSNALEQAEKIIREDQRAGLPTQIVAIMNNASLRMYLAWASYGVRTSIKKDGYEEYHSIGTVRVIVGYEPSATAAAKLDKLCHEDYRIKQERDAMRDKLQRAIAGCSTRKQAAVMFPELEKYLPGEKDVKTANLPAVANVVADLTKLGWPKGQVPA